MATTARAHFNQIIESAIDFANIVTDLNGIVTDWNRGATNVFGWKTEEIVGQAIE